MAPTRELAIQIKDEARKFSGGSVLKCVVAYGGTSTGFQLQTLFRGNERAECGTNELFTNSGLFPQVAMFSSRPRAA